MTLGVLVGWLAASLLAFTIFFYIVIYTMWLKRSTPQNIVIGGAAGALPPVIGWAAASGAIGIESLILFLIIFLWTPPHFWALALFKVGDYAAAGIPMMPNVAGPASTRRQILAYALLLAPVGVLPWFFGFTSGYYGIASVALGAGFIWHSWKVLAASETELKPAKALFAYSILYLFAIFAALLADTIAMLFAIFIAWLLTAKIFYEYLFGPAPPESISSFINAIFATGRGWTLIILGHAIGFVFAVVVLCTTVVAFPLLLDRDVGAYEAIHTSVRVVLANPIVMAVWGLIVAVGLIIGSLPVFVGLAVVLPILGHATWHDGN